VGSSRRIYGGAVRILSLVFVVVGIAILISTFANDGNALSLGLFLGIGFIGIGIARLYISGFFRSDG
jgi:hypothetical protein